MSARTCRICPKPIPDAHAVRDRLRDCRNLGAPVPPEWERFAFGLCSPECEGEHDRQRTLAKLTRGIVS